MEIIDLQSREVFSHQGRGVATLAEEPQLTILQIGLEPGKSVPVHPAEAPLTIQVLRGEGDFSVGDQTARLGPGKLLRVPMGSPMGIVNGPKERLVFLVFQVPSVPVSDGQTTIAGKPRHFVNLVDFAPLKPGREEAFFDWFRHSSEVFARHPGFVSRTLLGPIEGGSRYAAVVEHESKESFMDMHLSDDRERLFQQAEPLVLGTSKPHFYELLISVRK